MEQRIKVFIVDDHHMVRLGLSTYLSLEGNVVVIGEAENGKDAIEQLSNCSMERLPDIVLMDLSMPGMDGVEATTELLKRFPEMKVIILTSFLEDEKVVKAVEAGATDYVLKTVSSEQLAAAIQSAYNAQPTMSPEVAQALTRGLRQRTTQQDDDMLTAREKEVLLLIAEGKANKEIASELHISIKTVKTHVSNLLMKCELEDRTQLAIYAHRNGFVN